MDLRNGDCLEVMKELDDDSVDLLFADLPYGQTSCKWDCLIDLDLFKFDLNSSKLIYHNLYISILIKIDICQ